MDNDLERVRTALVPLCSPLYDALTSASVMARSRAPEFFGNTDLSCVLTHMTRGFALHCLQEQSIEGWQLRPRSRNAAIQLTSQGYALRVLHQLPDRVAPPPGNNWVRRQFYANPPLDEVMFPNNGESLLAIWAVDSGGGVRIRIARPIGTWKYGQAEKCDLSFGLPRVGADLAHLVFEPVDDDIEIVLPGEEEETGGWGVGGIVS